MVSTPRTAFCLLYSLRIEFWRVLDQGLLVCILVNARYTLSTDVGRHTFIDFNHNSVDHR